jgi:hypothetical protein
VRESKGNKEVLKGRALSFTAGLPRSQLCCGLHYVRGTIFMVGWILLREGIRSGSHIEVGWVSQL